MLVFILIIFRINISIKLNKKTEGEILSFSAHAFCSDRRHHWSYAQTMTLENFREISDPQLKTCSHEMGRRWLERSTHHHLSLAGNGHQGGARPQMQTCFLMHCRPMTQYLLERLRVTSYLENYASARLTLCHRKVDVWAVCFGLRELLCLRFHQYWVDFQTFSDDHNEKEKCRSLKQMN